MKTLTTTTTTHDRPTTRSTRRTPAVAGLRVLAVLTAALALGLGALVPATAAAPGSTPPAADGMATAWVRAAHLVPGMGTAQISLVPFAGSASGDVTKPGVPAAPLSDGARVVAPAAGYGTAGDYAQVPQGLYTVQVRAAGAPATSAPMITGTLDAQADQAYTLAALGSKDAPRIQTYSDDLRPPKAGTASVRLLAAATRASAVTVTARSGPVVARDAEFGRPTGYAAVPDGPWTLDVATTTTSGGEAMRGASTTGKVELRSGGVYTLLVLDGASSGVKLLPLVDAQGVPTAPREGVQTGGGGAARAPRQGVDAGLALAGLGGLVLLGVGLHRRVALRPLTRGRR